MRFHVRSKLLLVIIPFLLISLMSQNTFAANLSAISFFKLSYKIDNGDWREVIRVNQSSTFPFRFVGPSTTGYNWYGVNYFVGEFPITSVSGKYYSGSVNVELVGLPNTFTTSNCLGVDGYVSPEQGVIDNSTEYAECEVSANGAILNVTAVSRGSLTNTTSVSSLVFMVSNYANNLFSCSNSAAFQNPPCQNQVVNVNSVNYRFQMEEDPLIAGQNTLIEQNQEMINKENAAIENIDNQSASDIQGAENQATTNLIGVLSNFFTQLQNFQATNCNLDLPFPEFIGGTQTVNICQGKDVLGNFITVIGTLAMVGFYIPLAWVLLKMIYNEIRSFTNG